MFTHRSFGEFTLLQRLGAGGMAEVYLAFSHDTAPPSRNDLVALKRIIPNHANNPTYRAMFRTEVDILKRCNHPNIVSFHSAPVIDNIPSMTLEFLTGCTLEELVDRAHSQRISLGLDASLYIIHQTALALDHAHSLKGDNGEDLGIVHRDVSPQNIAVTASGHTKLFDFGIAHINTTDPDAPSSLDGTMVGKTAYMAPEQCRALDIDHRADLFALGIILWELTCDQRIFPTRDKLHIIRILTEDGLPTPSSRVDDYPEELERIVMRALSINPDDRYPTGKEFAQALDDFAALHGILLTPQPSHILFKHLFPQRERRLDDHLETLRAQHTSSTDPDNEPAPTKNLPKLTPDPTPDPPPPLPDIPPSTSLDNLNQLDHVVPIPPPPPEDNGSRILLVAGIFVVLVLLIGGVASFFLLSPNPNSPTPPTAHANGSVTVETTPPGASIRLNGRLLSVKTPTTIPSLPFDNTVDLQLELNRYQNAQTSFTPTAEHPTTTLRVTLEPASIAPTTYGGSLRVLVSPEQATLLIDDEEVANTSPVILEEITPTNEHTLRISKDGYHDAEIPFDVAQGELKEVEVELIEVTSTSKEKFRVRFSTPERLKANTPRFQNAPKRKLRRSPPKPKEGATSPPTSPTEDTTTPPTETPKPPPKPTRKKPSALDKEPYPLMR